MMGWYGGSGFGASWMLMGAFWVALALMMGWMAVRLLTRAEPMEPAVVNRSALELLDQRLAQGELDVATYRAQRALLLADPEPDRATTGRAGT